MEHYARRKYRGPETWRRARLAFLAGESAPSVARRFDVGLSNLRKKARAEGWTRKAHALDTDLKPLRGEADAHAAPEALDEAALAAPANEEPASCEPEEAFDKALSLASSALAAGRAGEAAALLKAAGELYRVAGPEAMQSRAAPPPEPPPSLRDMLFSDEGQEAVRTAALQLAQRMLEQPSAGPSCHSPYVYHWRARVLGPQAAEIDFAEAVSSGWAASLWDAEGRLRPLPQPASPEARMWAQHMSGCEWIAAREAEGSAE